MKPVILVVEDDVATRKLESLILTRGNYEVLETEDGAKALQIIEKTAIDIIISDILMPVMSGLELLQTLKSNMTTENIPVIICSSVSEQDSIREALGLGIAGYVLKPIVARELLLKVSKAEKHIVPILENPTYTMTTLNLNMNNFQELLFIMINDARHRLKDMGTKVEVGDFSEFEMFTSSLYASASNFGAIALKNTIAEARATMPKASPEKRGKYMFSLRTQLERLHKEIIRL